MHDFTSPERSSILARIKVERDPGLLYSEIGGRGPTLDLESGAWVVTRHSEMSAVLQDDRFVMAPDGWRRARGTSLTALIGRQLLFADGPDHRRVRAVIDLALASMLKTLGPAIRTAVGEVLQRLEGRGRFDAVRDFAVPVTTRVIALALGLPIADEEELARIKGWSGGFENFTSGHRRGAGTNILDLAEYFRQLAHRPAPEGSLLAAFAAHRDQFEDEDEMVSNLMMLLAAGQVTCEKLLGTGLHTLLAQDDLMDRTPRSKRALVDELLRVVTPTRWVSRWTTEAVEVGGVLIGRHQKVTLVLEAANRDQERFPDPHRLGLDRQPNPHLAFGHPRGAHYCPGAPLARLEVGIALEMLVERFPSLAVDLHSPVAWQPNPNLGGLASVILATGRSGHT